MSGADIELLSDDWVQALVAATADEAATSAPSATVALTIGKTRRAVVVLEAGRVVGPGADDDVEVTLPLTEVQLRDLLAGRQSLAKSYIRGDVKPEGSTGALGSLVELFESADLSALAQ